MSHTEFVSDKSLTMMKRVLDDECDRRKIRVDGIHGEELARVIMYAFLCGLTDEGELIVLARNLRL
jgi:hypothetical protein